MKILALAAALLASTAIPAMARLQLSIASGGSQTFSCFDGQLSCDVGGGANNLLTIDQTVGNAFVQITLAQSTFGKTNELQLSSSSIINEVGCTHDHHQPRRWRHRVSTDRTTFINSSSVKLDVQQRGRLAGLSTLQFFADPANAQGANPTNTPGALLESVSGHSPH